MTIDIASHIHHAIDATARIVHGIDPDQWHCNTPCDDWDVHAVTNHLVGGMLAFSELLTGGTADDDPTVDHLGDDPSAAYDAAAQADHLAWSRSDVLDGTVTLAFATLPTSLAAVIHYTELVVHGIDLAVATDQHHAIDEGLAQDLLDLMHAMGGIDDFRSPGFFGPAVPADPERLAHDRLLAYVGRNPTSVVAGRQRGAMLFEV